MKRITFLILSVCLLLYTASVYSTNNKTVSLIKIDDLVINPIVASFIDEQIQNAHRESHECLIIEMDTPGGLLNSTRTIVKSILNSPVPVIVYVAPRGSRAGSAGVFITMASHIAAMAPGTNIGAAHPVTIGGKKKNIWERLFDAIEKKPQEEEEEEEVKKKDEDSSESESVKEEIDKPESKEEALDESTDPMSDKILNDSVAWIRALAKIHHRNESWAAKAVTESASITAEEALEKNVIDLIAQNSKSLLEKIDGRTVTVLGQQYVLNTKNASIHICEMDLRKKILNIISNPTIAYILMVLGFYGLLYEITHPGIGVPGVAGFICIILAFLAFQTLPINYAGLLLIGLAIALFIAEANVPSFGLLTLGGIVSMVLGSLMLFESAETFARVSLTVILPVVITTALAVLFLCSLAIKAHRKKSLTGLSSLVEKTGTAETDLVPEGQVYIHGEIWKAVSDENISKGTRIKVVGANGLTLKVTKLNE